MIPYPAETGTYTFEATDCQGRKDIVTKNFASKNPLPQVSWSSMAPGDKEYVGYGSNLRLSFDRVTGEDVYYQVILRDYSGSIVDLYMSPPSKDTVVEIPADLPQPNTPYKWLVRTLDNAADPTVHTETPWCSFFTGSPGAAPSIKGLILSHNVPSRSTDFQVKDVTVAPWDIKKLKVYTTSVTQYKEYALDLQPITFLNQPARYGKNVNNPFPSENGNYAFELEDISGNKTFDTLYFQYDPLPMVPEATRVPVDFAYLATTTPKFDWDSIEENRSVYYNLIMRDYSNRFYWHAYPTRSDLTEHQIPEKDSLPIGCSFKWFIALFDKPVPDRAVNTPITQIRTLTINPSLRGRVKDKDTGGCLYNAFVEAKLEKEHYLTTTNADGYYEFADLSAGEYKIEVTIEGFHKGHASLSVEADKTFDQHFSLVPKKEKKEKKDKGKSQSTTSTTTTTSTSTTNSTPSTTQVGPIFPIGR